VGNVIAEDTLMAKLEDGTTVVMKVILDSIKEMGFSPFGGVNFSANITTQIAFVSLEELKEKVKDRPVHYPGQQLPTDGWEVVDVTWQRPAVIETTVNTSRGVFSFKTVTEATMAARNMNYRTPAGDPLYQIMWAYKYYWKPVKKDIVERLKEAKRTAKDVSPDELTYTYRVN
jgi:hypothetical protein